jgi:hypothetical protein
MLVGCLIALLSPVTLCSCNYRTGIAGFEGKGAVFAGRVLNVERPKDPRSPMPQFPVRVRFAVDSSWTPSVRDTVDVWTGFWVGDCAYPFLDGASYLVFAGEDRVPGLIALTCMRPLPLREAREDLLRLGPAPWRREQSAPREQPGTQLTQLSGNMAYTLGYP